MFWVGSKKREVLYECEKLHFKKCEHFGIFSKRPCFFMLIQNKRFSLMIKHVAVVCVKSVWWSCCAVFRVNPRVCPENVGQTLESSFQTACTKKKENVVPGWLYYIRNLSHFIWRISALTIKHNTQSHRLHRAHCGAPFVSLSVRPLNKSLVWPQFTCVDQTLRTCLWFLM